MLKERAEELREVVKNITIDFDDINYEIHEILNGPTMDALTTLLIKENGKFDHDKPLSRPSVEAFFRTTYEPVEIKSVDMIIRKAWGEYLIIGSCLWGSWDDDIEPFIALYNPKERKGNFFAGFDCLPLM